MNPLLGWSMAVVAVALAWWQYGAIGVALALSVVVFWLLLQFSRTLRALQQAGRAPVGHVGSALMLHARLKPGLTLLQLIQMTHSLGERLGTEGEPPERWRWADDAGVALTLELHGGKLVHWTLARPAESAPEGADGPG